MESIVGHAARLSTPGLWIASGRTLTLSGAHPLTSNTMPIMLYQIRIWKLRLCLATMCRKVRSLTRTATVAFGSSRLQYVYDLTMERRGSGYANSEPL